MVELQFFRFVGDSWHPSPFAFRLVNLVNKEELKFVYVLCNLEAMTSTLS